MLCLEPVRAQRTPVVAEQVVSWEDKFHICDIERKAMAVVMMEHTWTLDDLRGKIREYNSMKRGIKNGR